METARKSLYTLRGITIGYLSMGAPPLPAQDDCKAFAKLLTDAFAKLNTNPARVHSTRTARGGASNTDLIYAAGSIYMNIGGKWITAGPIKDAVQQMEQLMQNPTGKATCRYVKDEPVNGEMAALYTVHSETAKAWHDTQVWISKAKGLLLRQDLESNEGKSISSTFYEYGNVKPPL